MPALVGSWRAVQARRPASLEGGFASRGMSKAVDRACGPLLLSKLGQFLRHPGPTVVGADVAMDLAELQDG